MEGRLMIQNNQRKVGSSMRLTRVLEVKGTTKYVEGVGGLTGLLVTSSGVSNVAKEVMCTEIARRIRCVFIATNRVISSPAVLHG